MEPLGQDLSTLDEVLGFRFEESGRPYEGFQFLRVGCGIVAGLLVAAKQVRRDLVDPLIGALRGQDGGD